jgi:hypothetical protein
MIVRDGWSKRFEPYIKAKWKRFHRLTGRPCQFARMTLVVIHMMLAVFEKPALS